jgi:hypothetical protein
MLGLTTTIPESHNFPQGYYEKVFQPTSPVGRIFNSPGLFLLDREKSAKLSLAGHQTQFRGNLPLLLGPGGMIDEPSHQHRKTPSLAGC